ncbi:MAG: hypothetical protein J0I09_13725 [Sphingobacteriia bacterium]|nr:hypothetical protein [Sphingobacteriia bacterium]
MKKIFFALLLLIVSVQIIGCKKSNQTGTGNNNGIDSLPMPNTVFKQDTVRVMAYNILNYGDGCQGTTASLNTYFKTIIAYSKPDLLSCEKINSFNPSPGANGNLADDIANNVLNSLFPNSYSYATATNISGGKTMSVLFYNTQKFTFLKTVTLVNNITDFNLYKLYYKDVNLNITHDTTFLYVVVNHTQSGSASASRDVQVTQEMVALRSKFQYFPNLINMGDFNTSNSFEAGYLSVIDSTNNQLRMYDPPYYPDQQLTYPGNWDITPFVVAPYLTTSTRASGTNPNTCGTSGGAKSWFDHIFISPWIVNGNNYIRYMNHSYQTVGNDGNRLGTDINSTIPSVNNSAPSNVIDALFHLSNKYPVMLSLIIQANRNAISPPDPAEKN